MTPCFFVETLKVWSEDEICHNRRFTLGVVCSGKCSIHIHEQPEGETEDGLSRDDLSEEDKKAEKGYEAIRVERGDSFVIAAAVKGYRIVPEGTVELALVYPGEDMER